MVGFQVVRTVLDTAQTLLSGVSDISLQKFGSEYVLVAAAEGDSAITSYDFNFGGNLTEVDSQSYSAQSGTRTIWNLEFADVAGTRVLLPGTRYEDAAKLYTIGSGGGLSAGTSPGAGIAGLGLTLAARVGTEDLVFANSYGSLTIYGLDAGLQLTSLNTINDAANTYLGDISAFEVANVGGTDILFVTSAFDAGLGVYTIGTGGALALEDVVTPGLGSGFSRPAALQAVEVSGTHYLIMASSGSSSLTVYEVGANAKVTERFHLLDTLDTRFQGATLLEQFEYDGRSFLLAAGSDDGFTLLEVRPGGILNVLASYEDTYDIALDNISALDVTVFGDTAVVFASSPTDHGFTQINLDLGDVPEYLMGTAAADVLAGGSGIDLIEGLEGNDTLMGAAGNDQITDGAGYDRLNGGAGIDTFVFVQDGTTDVIEDFSLTDDQIDLSDFAGVNNLSDLVFISVDFGLLIMIDNEFLVIENAGPAGIEAGDLTADHFVF